MQVHNNGAVLDRPIAAFRLLTYLARETIDLPWLDAEEYLDISTARLREMEASTSLGDDDEDPPESYAPSPTIVDPDNPDEA